MNQRDKVNEVLKREKVILDIFKKIPTLREFSVGEKVGIAYTSNNRKHFLVAEIAVINRASLRVRILNSKDENRTFSVKIDKQTSFNRVFKHENLEDVVQELNYVTKFIYNYVEGKINEFWEEKISKAEQEEKERGITPHDIWVIDEKGFHKSHTSYDISV